MKLLKIIIIILWVVPASLLYLSCAKTAPVKLAAVDINLNNAALVQVVNATVGSTRTYVYVDGNPVTGSTLSFGSVFPGSGFTFRVTPGLRSFSIRDTLKTSTQIPINFFENFEAGKKYIIFMYDTTTLAKQITVENDLVIPADTSARLRFANFIYNTGTPLPVDVFSKRLNANIFTNVSKTQVTPYIPFASSVNDTFLVRETGTTNLLATLNGFNATPKRSYTLIYRGSYLGTRVLSTFTND
jgi:uncharacterized protein DUF4397